MRIIMVLPYSSLVSNPSLFGDGYHVRTAKEIWKRSHKHQLECWRTERVLKQEVSGEKDGIIYRAFPSWRPSLGKLTPLVYKGIVNAYAPLRWSVWREYSMSLIKALKKESEKGDVLIHLMHIPFDLSYMICLACGDKVPIVGQHIGGNPYGYNAFSYLTNMPFSFVEQKALSKIDVMLVGTEWHARDFERCFKVIPKVLYPFPQCVDFDLFKPMDKLEARKQLGIDPKKKVIIHIGRFDSAKGFDAILDILPTLGQHYPVEFIAIGGTKHDLLYDRARGLGARVLEWLPQQELVKYYSASDVYLFPKFYDKESEADTEKFMGAGVACAEALGCGLPVIGTNLKGFFATPEELKGIGGIPKDKDDLVGWVEDCFDNPERYNRCREVAMKYYSWQPIVERLLDVYDELKEKYYG